jgi:hypothetical protein
MRRKRSKPPFTPAEARRWLEGLTPEAIARREARRAEFQRSLTPEQEQMIKNFRKQWWSEMTPEERERRRAAWARQRSPEFKARLARRKELLRAYLERIAKSDLRKPTASEPLRTRTRARTSRRTRGTRTRPVHKATADPDGEPPPPVAERFPSGPLTDGEKQFLDFLFEQAVKPWST